jgi:hypothetical protein
MRQHADFRRWISAIAGVFLGAIALGTSLAHAASDNETPVNEEIISDIPDDEGISQDMASHQIVQQDQGPAGPRAVVCVAGCVGQVGEVVFSQAAAEDAPSAVHVTR